MQIIEDGFGAFHATNGVDTVYAKYERGTKTPQGFRPHWNLSFYGETITVYLDKAGVLEHVSKMLTCPQDHQMTSEETQHVALRDGEVHGIVGVPLREIIHRDFDEFLDLLNDLLTEESLSGIEYCAVGVSPDGTQVNLRVSGQADFMEDAGDEPEH